KHKDNVDATMYVVVFDIQFKNAYQNTNDRLQHESSGNEVRDGLSSEIHASEPPLQLFGWHDWQLILRALHTPCELWRFLQYRLEQTHYSASSHVSNLKTEEAMISGF